MGAGGSKRLCCSTHDLFARAENGKIIIRDVSKPDAAPAEVKHLGALQGHESWVYCIAVSSTGLQLVSGSYDEKLIVWDATTMQQSGVLVGHADWIISAKFSPDDKFLVSSSFDNTLRIWNMKTMQCDKVLRGHKKRIYGVSWSAKQDLIASAGEDKKCILWDTKTGQAKKKIESEDFGFKSVQFNHDGTRLYTTYSANATHDPRAFEIACWDTKTEKQLGRGVGHLSSVTALAISPDFSMLATGSNRCVIILWDTTTMTPIGEPLQGHTEVIYGLAFSPNSRLLTSCSKDMIVRCWSVDSMNQIAQLQQEAGSMANHMAFSADGASLYLACQDNTLRVMDLIVGEVTSLTECDTNDLISIQFVGWTLVARFKSGKTRNINAPKPKSMQPGFTGRKIRDPFAPPEDASHKKELSKQDVANQKARAELQQLEEERKKQEQRLREEEERRQKEKEQSLQEENAKQAAIDDWLTPDPVPEENNNNNNNNDEAPPKDDWDEDEPPPEDPEDDGEDWGEYNNHYDEDPPPEEDGGYYDPDADADPAEDEEEEDPPPEEDWDWDAAEGDDDNTYDYYHNDDDPPPAENDDDPAAAAGGGGGGGGRMTMRFDITDDDANKIIEDASTQATKETAEAAASGTFEKPKPKPKPKPKRNSNDQSSSFLVREKEVIEPKYRKLKRIFDSFDTDGSGFLEKNEIMPMIMQFFPDCSPTQMQQKVIDADTNKDNRISFSEYKKLVEHLF